MPPHPLILLTNDDGFFAEGLQALSRALRGLGRLVIVAPDREKSASSLALSLHRPLRVQHISRDTYAVDGTPADCVYLALKRFLPRVPDLLVSGMNAGPNLGQQDVSYSGTVAAAIQGTFFLVPSVAVSLIADRDGVYHFRESALFVKRLAARLLARRPAEGVTLNVNVPPPPVRGVKITKVGVKRYEPEIIEKTDPRDNSYFWIGRGNPRTIGTGGTDVAAARDGFISVTPLRVALTDYGAMRSPWLKVLAGPSSRSR
jgi:5'-nucleotidase